MDSQDRASLARQAESQNWADRCQAGVLLAAVAQDERTHSTLLRLLQDAENTAVPADTALALLRRHDLYGLRLVASAFASGSSDAHDELVTLLFRADAYDWWPLEPALESLSSDDDATVREGARQMLRALAGGGE